MDVGSTLLVLAQAADSATQSPWWQPVVTIAGTAAVAYMATVRANLRSQGSLETKITEGFRQVRADIHRIEKEKADQWKAINVVRTDISTAKEDVARLEGQMEGHMKAAAELALRKVRESSHRASAGG